MTYNSYRIFISVPVALSALLLANFLPEQNIYIASSAFVVLAWIFGAYNLWALQDLQLNRTPFVKALTSVGMLPGLQKALHVEWLFGFLSTLLLMIEIWAKIPPALDVFLCYVTLLFSAYTLSNIGLLSYRLYDLQQRNADETHGESTY